MAAVTTSPEVTGVDTQQRTGRVTKVVRAVRELPLIPLAVLIFLLVIPAIFANQLAPHNQRIGVLDDAKLPPFWVSESFESRTVVQRADKDRLDVEIGLTNARRKVERGDPTVAPGVAFEVAAMVGVALFHDDDQRRDLEAEHLATRLAVLPSVVRPPVVDDDF